MKLRILILLGGLLFSAHAKEAPPTFPDVSYGTHERNVLDFWQAEGDGPRPLLVDIHGGSWLSNGKEQILGRIPIKDYLSKGISVASISYRYSTIDPLPAPVHDAARAIQFLKSKACEWNINKDRIALQGTSAGGCSCMWILLHDDLKDPTSPDPVLRESSRVCAAATHAGQTTIDPRHFKEWIGEKWAVHSMVWKGLGAESKDAVWDHYADHQPLITEFSPITHLDKDDPPLWMSYGSDTNTPATSGGHSIHHPMLGLKMKEKADAIGHESHLSIKGAPPAPEHATSQEFLLQMLLD